MIPVWLEAARTPLLRIFTPDLDPKRWRIILARIEVDFLAEIAHGVEVTILTHVGSLGRSSLKVAQRILQDGKEVVRAQTVLVNFDYEEKKAVPIEGDLRRELSLHLVDEGE